MLKILSFIFILTFINIHAQFIQGTFEGEASGSKDDQHSGVVKVSITLSAHKIESIEVVEFDQDTIHKKYGLHVKEALDRIPKRIINSQSVIVDAVTMATATSQAIELAAAKAIYKGLLKNFYPGSYKAEITGWSNNNFAGNIVLKVEFDDNNLESIEIVNFEQDTLHEKYGPLAEKARDTIPARVVENQDLEVDAISGATMSSNAILIAVFEAVCKAVKMGQAEKGN